MMVLWGALHTSTDTEFVDGRLVMNTKRTSSVERNVYVEIIRILVASGADSHYDVTVSAYEHNKRLHESL